MRQRRNPPPAGPAGLTTFALLPFAFLGSTPLAKARAVEPPRIVREWRAADSGTDPIVLAVGGSATDGELDSRRGALRFVLAANDAEQPPGKSWTSLFQAGDWRKPGNRPAWRLAVNPEGMTLHVLSRRPGAQPRTNFTANFNWRSPSRRPGLPTASPRWHEITLNWEPRRIEVLLDGALAKDPRNRMWQGTPLPPLPAGTECRVAPGPRVRWRAATLFDKPVSLLAQTSFREHVALSARVEVKTHPPAVTLRWFGLNPARPTEVHRRALGQTEWTRLGETEGFTWRDADPRLQLGRTYEYAAGKRRIIVPLAAPPREQRGRVLVLVDRTLERRLRTSLDQFEEDLVGDGWTVSWVKAPRHDDDTWRRGPVNKRYREDVAEVKSRILLAQQARPSGLAAVILVGHVTIPYAGTTAEDGHPEHRGAWPADAFYGDLDGHWADGPARTPDSVRHPVLRNVPGDGKFDANTFAALRPASPPGTVPGIEVPVGRIDFANLPALRGRSELELLRGYFAKNHRYRMKRLVFLPRVAAGGFFYTPHSATGRGLYANALEAASRLLPDGADAAFLADAFGDRVDCQWSMQGGYGAPDALHNNVKANRIQGTERYDTAWLADPAHEPKAGFHLLLGSYFGDWNLGRNNFPRACVALPNSGLAAIWARGQLWRFAPLGAGAPLGEILRLTARDRASTRTTFLLGDPTLRLQITAPPGDVTIRRTGGGNELTWEPSPEAGARYTVYGWNGQPDEQPKRLHAVPLSEPRFTDPRPDRATKLYLVRALAEVTTGSGSFTNLSQAAFARAR